MPDNLIGLPRVMALLDCSRGKVKQLIASGELPVFRFGGAKRPEYKFRPADVERVILARRVTVAARRPRRVRGERIPEYV